MPRTATRATKTKARSSRKQTNAITILTQDHANVRKMFKQYEKVKETADDGEKAALVETICNELKLHTEVEEAIFYPAARAALEEQDLLDEAEVEHASAKALIGQLEGMQPSDELYDAKVTVLGEYIEHHVKEEEKQMFPKARKSRMDLEELGERIKQHKEQALQ
jgi:hemerythrin-like domain-containing protein